MGMFTNVIPERKWQSVALTLSNQMKSYRATWFKEFTDYARSLELGPTAVTLNAEIDDRIGALQFVAAATTVRENAYVKLKDFDFFIGLVCIVITSKRMDELNKLDVEILIEGDPKVAIQKWALSFVPLVANVQRNQKLAEVISQWAALLVIKSKIQTCDACLDTRGADAIRRSVS